MAWKTGGRWGDWADGGGSSLEVVDPRADKRLADNWADSDETTKAQWVTIEHTGVLDNGANYEGSIAHGQVGIMLDFNLPVARDSQQFYRIAITQTSTSED